jgi:putative lipoic acid-binding regulatory protein
MERDSDDRDADPRRRAIALLESQHVFPGPFEFRVVIRPDGRAAALGALISAAGPEASLLEVTERASQGGRYLSLRVKVHLDSADVVLDIYEVLREVDQVITAL